MLISLDPNFTPYSSLVVLSSVLLLGRVGGLHGVWVSGLLQHPPVDLWLWAGAQEEPRMMTTTEIPLFGPGRVSTSFLMTTATVYLSLAQSLPWQSRRFSPEESEGAKKGKEQTNDNLYNDLPG